MNNLDGIVNSLAKKFNVAADKIAPLAKKTVEQYQTAAKIGLLFGAAQVVFGFACGVVAYHVIEWLIVYGCFEPATSVNYPGFSIYDGTPAQTAIWGVVGIVSGTLAVLLPTTGVGDLFKHWSRYVAPLPHMLGLVDKGDTNA